jgi:hypothetical protein
MKNLVMLCLIMALSFTSRAQVVVGGVDINALDIYYIEIAQIGGPLGTVRINYGQQNATLWIKREVLSDEMGQPFRNVLAAFNFLYRNGWELMPQVALKAQGEVETYMFRRR